MSYSADLTQLAGQGMLSYRVASSVQGPAMSNGKPSFILVNQNGKGQALSKAGTILSVIGFGTGVANDMANKGKKAGQAIVHNGVSIVTGLGATALIGLFVPGVAIGVVAAIVGGSIFEIAYENVPEIQAFLDKGGNLIDTGWKNYSDSFSKQMKAGMTRGV